MRGKKKAATKTAATKKTANKIEGASAMDIPGLGGLTAANRRKFVETCSAAKLDPIKTLNGVVSGFNKAINQ